jgi:hypothetical protein
LPKPRGGGGSVSGASIVSALPKPCQATLSAFGCTKAILREPINTPITVL